jgi:hypothetical protein
VNIFEGGRRLTRLLQGVIILGAVYNLVYVSPYLNLIYETTGPAAPFGLTQQWCGSDDEPEWLNAQEFPEGYKADLTLCFRSALFSNGKRLIPYRSEGDTVWGNDKYSAPVVSYLADRKNTFVLTDALKKEAVVTLRSQWWSKFWKEVLSIVETGGIFFLIITFVSWVIGWVIRGFMGIERGSDKRASVTSP